MNKFYGQIYLLLFRVFTNLGFDVRGEVVYADFKDKDGNLLLRDKKEQKQICFCIIYSEDLGSYHRNNKKKWGWTQGMVKLDLGKKKNNIFFF